MCTRPFCIEVKLTNAYITLPKRIRDPVHRLTTNYRKFHTIRKDLIRIMDTKWRTKRKNNRPMFIINM